MSDFQKSQARIDSANQINWPMIVGTIFVVATCMALAVRAIG